jgi:hypothetical protein
MESLKRSIKYQFMESKSFILGFWSTVLIINVFFYVLNNMSSIDFRIGFSLGAEVNGAISVAGINIMIILISLLVYNFESNYESFPLAISLSMSRKNYFLSFLVDNVFIAFVFAIIQSLLLKIDPFLVKLIGKVPLNDFLYFNVETDNIFFITFTLFILFLLFISFWNFISSLNYKFGYKMWIVLIGLNIVLPILNLDILSQLVESAGNMLEFRFGAFQALTIILTTAVLYILNYFVVMRTNVKKKIG